VERVSVSEGHVLTITELTVLVSTATPTATVYKQGAEAQKAEGASLPKIGWHTLPISYSPFGMLVFIALGMMFL
jgi:hypothetical protein